MLEDYLAKMSTRSLKLMLILMIVVPSILAMSGCAIPVAVPAGGYYQQQPYYNGTQVPLRPSPMWQLQQQNYYNNHYRGYYGGGYYPVSRGGFNLQIQIQGGNGGYYHGGRW